MTQAVTKAQAPGKLVLSGAYSVLEGAPALVLAVDRYVLADAARAAEYEAEEVLAAVALGIIERPVWYDVSALRSGGPGDRKLGLGSSAAIVVACLAACRLAAGEPAEGLAAGVFDDALRAHRRAQPRGSGIDVAASCFGGVVRCVLDVSGPQRGLSVSPHSLPVGITIEVYASQVACSTAGMLRAVEALRAQKPAAVRAWLERAGQGAAQACEATTVAAFAAALRAQHQALGALGQAAGVGIVTDEVAALDALAEREAASFGPSGAGGGDVALYVGEQASSVDFRARAAEAGLCPLPLRVGVAGVSAVTS